MKFLLFEICLLLVMCLSCIATETEKSRFTVVRHTVKNPKEEQSFLACNCSISGQTRVDLPKNVSEELFKQIVNNKTCEIDHPGDICNRLKTCNNCTLAFEICYPRPGKGDFDCIKSHVEIGSNYFGKYTTDSHHRVPRQAAGCSYPTNLKTADVSCTAYPRSVKCKEKCIFGYTLREGILRSMQCNYTENKWKPIGFEECRPFVDCSLTLVSAGTVDCVTATTKSAPVCQVACDHYEDKAAVPKQSYTCKLNGSWSKLPFCVVPGSGLDLVPAPPVKFHDYKYKD